MNSVGLGVVIDPLPTPVDIAGCSLGEGIFEGALALGEVPSVDVVSNFESKTLDCWSKSPVEVEEIEHL